MERPADCLCAVERSSGDERSAVGNDDLGDVASVAKDQTRSKREIAVGAGHPARVDTSTASVDLPAAVVRTVDARDDDRRSKRGKNGDGVPRPIPLTGQILAAIAGRKKGAPRGVAGAPKFREASNAACLADSRPLSGGLRVLPVDSFLQGGHLSIEPGDLVVKEREPDLKHPGVVRVDLVVRRELLLHL